MLLQTNSYIVPKEKRAEHARLMRRFRQILNHLGCDSFEVYEQVGNNWGNGSATGRFVQIMRFRDRKHQLSVQAAERTDPTAQELIAEFCELVNYPYQQQNGLFAIGFYTSVLPVAPARVRPAEESQEVPQQVEAPAAGAAVGAAGGFAAAAVQEQPGEQEQSAFEQMSLDEEAPEPEQTPDEEQAAADEQVVEEQAIAEPEFETPVEEQPVEEFASNEPEAIDEDEGSGFVLEAEQPAAPAQPEPAAPVPAATDDDDWSIMDEARAIDDSDEESIGIELHSEPSNGHGTPPIPASAKPPVNQEPVPEIDLGLDDEEEDDLVDMADRFIEDENSSKKPTPPRRR